MKYKQRDLVFVELACPDGKILRHPYLIVSNRSANSHEKYYTGVMMSATDHKDRFSFPVDSAMFEGDLRKSGCNLRLYIITGFREEQVGQLITTMHIRDFKNVVEEINDIIFSIDYN